jgi:hypothetical protein
MEKWSLTLTVMEWGGEATGWHRSLMGRGQGGDSTSFSMAQ